MNIVSDNIKPYPLHPPAAPESTPGRHVRLFRNGANQAVRIPKEFEFSANEAIMHRVGDKLIIQAIAPTHPKGSAAALLAVLATMQPIDDEFPDVDEGLLPLDDIVL